MSLEKVPQCLRDLPNWVLWKEIIRSGERTKLPYQIDGEMAKSNDPSTWATFEDAEKRFKAGGYSGLGFMFSADDPFCGIDLDGCRDPETGVVADWAREIIKTFDSYTEVSPSRTGVKLFIHAKSPFDVGRKCPVDQPKVSSKSPGVEMYDKLRYFAVTGIRVGGVSPEVESRQVQLDGFAQLMFPVKEPAPYVPPVDDVSARAAKYLAKMPVAVSGNSGHNTTFHAACVLVLGFGLSINEAYPLLAEWNKGCQPVWSERELWHKLNSAAKQQGERNYLRDARQQDWDRVKVPKYVCPPPHTDVRVTTLEDAANNYLEASKNASPLIDLGIPDVDYAIGGGVELGEMVIMAARPSHGKSAVALQCIHNATGLGRPSLIISEEMSALALGKRAVQFASDVPQEHWRTSSDTVEAHVRDHFQQRAKCIVFESCGTVERAAEEIRRAVNEHGVTFAVVDYAQLLGSSGKTRYEQTTNTSIALRQVASSCKIILIVLAQLNRAIESRSAFTPLMSDLKDTGQLEQDADVILFLCWPHRIDASKPANEYQIFVGKNRNRAINQVAVTCRFEPSRQMFLAERGHAAPFDEPVPGQLWTGENQVYAGAADDFS